MPVYHGDFFEGMKKMKDTLHKFPTQIAAEALRFFFECFRLQGWQGDGGLEPWDKRKYSIDPNRKILYGPQTHEHLRDSLRKQSNGQYIKIEVVGAPAKYADLHNFGGVVTVPVTAKMRKWAWAMFYKTKNDMYKGMALTKKSTLTITIPKRQFIGNSKQLDDKLYALMEYHLKQALNEAA